MNDTFHTCGRPDLACLTADKWQLLNDLTSGSKAFNLGHRTLSVLKALLTFLPGRTIAADTPAVVFPSNRTLSHRLNGMPESTLRRHLAALVKSGFVSRRDSPNRKRYARFAERDGIAFGFDLAPLARAAAQILKAAERMRARAKARAVLHARLTDLCHRIADDDLTHEARKALRRQNNNEELASYIDNLSPCAADEPSATNSQNERHLQGTEKKESVNNTMPQLADIQRACPTACSFYPDGLSHWNNAIHTSRQIAPMMGIEQSVVADAEKRLGAKHSAVTILTMLEKLPTLHNPGGYLRRLAKLGSEGRFTATSLVKAQNCQLTIPKPV